MIEETGLGSEKENQNEDYKVDRLREGMEPRTRYWNLQRLDTFGIIVPHTENDDVEQRVIAAYSRVLLELTLHVTDATGKCNKKGELASRPQKSVAFVSHYANAVNADLALFPF